jgi:OmpA-OmpF porin, OOP family
MRTRPRFPRAVTVVAAVAVAALLAVPAVGQEAGPTVVDALEDGDVPTASEIAERVGPIEPVVRAIEVPEPRSLRQDVEEGERTTVSIASDVLFAFDSADLSARAEATVRDLAEDVREATGTVDVVGHTDSVGTDAYNQDLSERRSEAVAAVLADELGSGVDLVTEGRGSQEPVAEESEDDPGAAARNRRVEIAFDR